MDQRSGDERNLSSADRQLLSQALADAKAHQRRVVAQNAAELDRKRLEAWKRAKRRAGLWVD